MKNKIIIYKVCEISKKGNIINTYYECTKLDNARVLRKQKLKHLVEAELIEGTLVILDSRNKIIS